MRPTPEQIAQEVRLWQQIGGAKQRRRIPQQQLPAAIEREYAKELQKIFDVLKKQLEPLLEALPSLTRQAREQILRGDSRRDSVDSELDRILGGLRERNFNQKPLEDLAAHVASQTKAHNAREFARQTKAALGVDLFSANKPLQTVTNNFMREQVALIKDLPAKTIKEIEGIVIRGVGEGRLHSDIAKQIDERLNIGKKRAAGIARDQVGKFYGVVNRERQKDAGLKRFRWRTVGDGRVRDEHASLDGEIFSWDNPPSEGIPGQEINCRCTSEPIFEEILAEMSGEELSSPQVIVPRPGEEGLTQEALRRLRRNEASARSKAKKKASAAGKPKPEPAKPAPKPEPVKKPSDGPVGETKEERFKRKKKEAAERFRLKKKAEKEAAAPKIKPPKAQPKPSPATPEMQPAIREQLDPSVAKDVVSDFTKDKANFRDARVSIEKHLDARGYNKLSPPGTAQKHGVVVGETGKADAHRKWSGEIVMRKDIAEAAKRFAKAYGDDPERCKALIAKHAKTTKELLAKRDATEALQKTVSKLDLELRRLRNNRGADTPASVKVQDEMRRNLGMLREAQQDFNQLSRQVQKSPEYKMFKDSEAIKTVHHEVFHGYGPAQPWSYKSGGQVIEEVTTETLARREMITGYGVPRDAFDNSGHYREWMQGMNKNFQQVYKVDYDGAQKLMEATSDKYKRRSKSVMNPAQAVEAFLEDIPEGLTAKEQAKFKANFNKLVAGKDF